MKKTATISLNGALEQGYEWPVAGIDEAGRGPWAGPVIAAAVILDPHTIPAGLNDSKKLSKLQREKLFHILLSTAIIGVGEASVEEIDRFNILSATKLAMRRAVQNLATKPATCLVDGNQDPLIGIPTHCIIKGDQKSASIAAASIIAKQTRDQIMTNLSQEFPAYGWEKNAGYGVPHHQRALESVGISIHHRKSFKPIYKLIGEDS